jgi:hypothetical protein
MKLKEICAKIGELKKQGDGKHAEEINSLREEYEKLDVAGWAAYQEYERLLARLKKECGDTSCRRHHFVQGDGCRSL